MGKVKMPGVVEITNIEKTKNEKPENKIAKMKKKATVSATCASENQDQVKVAVEIGSKKSKTDSSKMSIDIVSDASATGVLIKKKKKKSRSPEEAAAATTMTTTTTEVISAQISSVEETTSTTKKKKKKRSSEEAEVSLEAEEKPAKKIKSEESTSPAATSTPTADKKKKKKKEKPASPVKVPSPADSSLSSTPKLPSPGRRRRVPR